MMIRRSEEEKVRRPAQARISIMSGRTILSLVLILAVALVLIIFIDHLLMK